MRARLEKISTWLKVRRCPGQCGWRAASRQLCGERLYAWSLSRWSIRHVVPSRGPCECLRRMIRARGVAARRSEAATELAYDHKRSRNVHSRQREGQAVREINRQSL